MAFQPVGNAAETVIKGKLAGEDAFVTQGWLGTVGFTLGNMNELATEVEDWWYNQVMPSLPATYVFNEVVVNDLRSQTGLFAASNTYAGEIGGTGQPAMPNNCTFCIKFSTGLRGRTQRGRNYIPGIPYNQATQNTVYTAWADGMVNAYTNLTAASGFSMTWSFS